MTDDQPAVYAGPTSVFTHPTSLTRREHPPRSGSIVLVGGYGQVGQEVARVLAPRFPGRVVLAGRTLPAAQAAAAAIGHGTRAALVDADRLHQGDTDVLLTDAALVLACAGHTRPALAEASLRAGADYADVTADGPLIARIEELDPLARRHGVAAVLSVGLAPGLTNLLAAAACAGLDSVDRVDLLVRLGVGDIHGPAALGWTLDALNAVFAVAEHKGSRQVRAFAQRRKFVLPDPLSAAAPGDRPGRYRPVVGYRFDFPEQRTLPRTLGVPVAASWLALDPPLVGTALALASRSGASRLLSTPRARRLTLAALSRTHIGSDIAAAAATATGLHAGAPAELTLAVTGHSEATITAHVTALVAEKLLTQGIAAGVHHLEQVMTSTDVLTALRSRTALPPLPTDQSNDQTGNFAPGQRSRSTKL